jgi:hypothetical protein
MLSTVLYSSSSSHFSASQDTLTQITHLPSDTLHRFLPYILQPSMTRPIYAVLYLEDNMVYVPYWFTNCISCYQQCHNVHKSMTFLVLNNCVSEGTSHQGCDVPSLDKLLPAFWRIAVPPSSGSSNPRRIAMQESNVCFPI